MQSFRVLAIAASGLTYLWAPAATAEEKNPDAIACEGKREGDPCQRTVVVKPTDGEAETRRQPGVCRTGECCTLDYSKGSPPESVCSPCLTCQPGPADGDLGAAGASGAAQSEPPRAGNGDDPPASAPKGRGCRAGDPDPAWAWIPLLLVGAGALRRRRV